MGPQYRYVKKLTGQHIRSTDTAPNHSRPRPVNSRIRPLGPAQTKFHNSVASGRIDYPGRLGGNQTLMVDNGQDGRLYQLRLHDRSNHFDQRLPWKYDRPLRDRVNIPAEMKIAQIFQKVLVKYSYASQIVHIFPGKMQIFNVVNDLIQARRYGKPVPAGIGAVKRIEDHRLLHRIFKIPLHHGQFIQIGQKCQILCCTHREFPSC